MMVWMTRHWGGCHGTELVGMMVSVHRSQVRTTVHSPEVGARWVGVALAVGPGLVIRHGVGRSG